MSKSIGVNRNILRKILKKAQSQEEFIELIEKSRTPVNAPKVITYKGKNYSSIGDACKALGLSSCGLSHIIARCNENNLSLEDELDSYFKRKIKEVSYHGVQYRTVTELASAIGLSYKVVHYHWRQSNGCESEFNRRIDTYLEKQRRKDNGK